MTMETFYLYQEQNFDSFTKRVIKNIAIDIQKGEAALFRKERSLSDLSYTEAAQVAVEDTYHLDDDACVPFDLLGFPIIVRDPVLEQALFSLPPKCRDVVLLFYFADQNEPQIGKLLNISTMAVNVRHKKALDTLRKLLEATQEGSPIRRYAQQRAAIQRQSKRYSATMSDILSTFAGVSFMTSIGFPMRCWTKTGRNRLNRVYQRPGSLL